MEKRNIFGSYGELEGVEEESVEESSPNTVFIRLLREVKYKAVGKSTGQEYVWNGAGSVVEVNSEDADAILDANKKKPSSCCAGETGKVFEMIE